MSSARGCQHSCALVACHPSPACWSCPRQRPTEKRLIRARVRVGDPRGRVGRGLGVEVGIWSGLAARSLRRLRLRRSCA
jgi:hypothetical protein